MLHIFFTKRIHIDLCPWIFQLKKKKVHLKCVLAGSNTHYDKHTIQVHMHSNCYTTSPYISMLPNCICLLNAAHLIKTLLSLLPHTSNFVA